MLVRFVVCCVEECYLVLWEEENSVSVVSTSNVTKGREAAVGECCEVACKCKTYIGRIAAKGTTYLRMYSLATFSVYIFQLILVKLETSIQLCT